MYTCDYSGMESMGQESKSNGRFRRRRVQADAMRGRGCYREADHTEAGGGMERESRAFSRRVYTVDFVHSM